MLSVVRRKLSSIVDMQETVRQSSQMLESDAAIFLKRAIVARMLQKIKYQDSEVLKDCLEKTCAYNGEVFGKSAIECGNYRNLDIDKAKKQCADYLNIIKEANENSLCYDK